VDYISELKLMGVDSSILEKYIELLQTPLEENTYTEVHHILPRCIYPQYTNEPSNLKTITGENHLLAHYWLTKMFPRIPFLAAAYIQMLGRGAYLDLKEPPGKELMRQFGLSRMLWSQYMKNMLTVRIIGERRYVQIPRSEFDPNIHEHITSGFTVARDPNTGTTLSVPMNDSRLISGELVHINKGMTTVLDTLTGNNVRMTSEEYANCDQDRFQGLVRGKPSPNPNIGRIPRMVNGLFKWVEPGSIEDLEGKPVHLGKVTVLEISTGNRFHADKHDPRLLAGEVVPQSKGMATVRDISGRELRTDAPFPRNQARLPPEEKSRIAAENRRGKPLSEETKIKISEAGKGRVRSKESIESTAAANRGMATVKDRDGNFLKVPKDDPRISSGELVSINFGRIRCRDHSGKEFRVQPQDPRVLNGELIPFTKSPSPKPLIEMETSHGNDRIIEESLEVCSQDQEDR
jgi:hypothetical protein